MGTFRETIESVVSGFGFSVFCCAVWGGLTSLRARGLLREVVWMEVVWLACSATIAILFLVRARPKTVSLLPVHWLVALLTSFSGPFFEKESASIAHLETLADWLILAQS